MHVLQVSKFYAPYVGGIERVVEQLARGCERHGHRATVLAAAERGWGSTDRVDGIPVVRTGSPGTVLSTPMSPTYPLQRRLLGDVDVVHVHLPNPLAVLSELLADRTDTPVVATYHSDIVRQRIAGRLYRPLLDRFLDSVDRIIATSPRLRDNSPVLSRYREKTDVVPLSVPLDEVGTAPEGPLPTDAPGPYVLFVGRLNYYKGVEYLVDAMANVDATLLVVGDGPRRETLRQRAADSDASVVFLGHVDDGTLARCYADADVFVLPSVEPSEAFGIVQLEAMAHGVPVVNTDLPTGVPWVSRHEETGLTVPPRDSEALTTAIRQLLDDEQWRQELGAAARERVTSLFTEDRMVSDTIDIYDSVR